MDYQLNSKIFDTLLSNDNYHSYIINDFINSRSHIKNQAIIQLRDRGNKYDLYWDFYISPNLANSFILRHRNEYSFYKIWLSYRTNVDTIEIKNDILCYVMTANTPQIARLGQHNGRECYGICMLLFEILNRLYIYNSQISAYQQKINPYDIVRLATYYCITYTKYHIEYDALKSVDILSNFARMQDLYQSITLNTLFDVPIPGIGMKFMYIWAMLECSKILPPIGINYHYLSNALMMHQNQTVGGVVVDPMETPFNDCAILGHDYAANILTKYEDAFDNNSNLIANETLEEELTMVLEKICQLESKNNTIKYQQFLNKIIQIEDFDGLNIIEPPYIPAPLNYRIFLNKLGLNEVEIDNVNLREESNGIWKYTANIFNELYGRPISYSDETYGKFFRQHKDTKATFRDITLMLDSNKNVISFSLTGHLYPVKKDIDWTNLFYGIPCAITYYDFPQKLMEDRLIIAVFGASETFDKTLFDKRYV